MTDLVPAGALVTRRAHPYFGGEQIVARFPNGYGASIVRHPYSCGGGVGLWELDVIVFDGEGPDQFGLTYDTPITSDVIGWLTEAEALAHCADIAQLPARGGEMPCPRNSLRP